MELFLTETELEELKSKGELYVDRNDKQYIVIETHDINCPYCVFEAWDLTKIELFISNNKLENN